MSIACFISASLIYTGSLLRIIHHFDESSRFDFQKWANLDPVFLKKEWAHRQDTRELFNALEILSALGWFALCVPIIQLAWILSKGGRRQIGMHFFICLLAAAGSMAELLSHLMALGVQSAAEFMVRDFNLNRWLGTETSNDGLGWRTLELAHMLARGTTLWVDAFNWLTLFGIQITLYFSIRTDSEGTTVFGRRWSLLGLVIGILCFIDFLSSVSRYEGWGLFPTIATFLSILNMLFFLPIWLLVLGCQLPKASKKFESAASRGEGKAFFENEQEVAECS